MRVCGCADIRVFAYTSMLISMQKICANTWCKQSFEITSDDLAFYDKVSPVIGGKKFSIPPPTRCPGCRQQRRLGHANERNLYPGQCGLCGKRTLTQFPPHSSQPYYCPECWHSDRWDAQQYGRAVDFERSFFAQLAELRRAVPALALSVQGENQNSAYMHYAGSSKNCYLIMHADFCDDCYYGYGFKKNRSCMDGFYNLHSELLYDCIDCHTCYALKNCQDCFNCSTSAFLRDCVGCSYCFQCVGLREKRYCFGNEQLSQGGYTSRIATIHTGSYRTYQEYAALRRMLELEHPFKEYQGHNLENCTGNHLYNCKNVRESFDCEDVEDAKYCTQLVLGSKNVYDVYQYGTNLQNSYECVVSGEHCDGMLFCIEVNLSCADLLHCWYMEASKNCFGCAGMQRAQYCILNEQYSKDDYEILVPKLIAHMKATPLRLPDGSFAGQEWGELIGIDKSQFGYNRTTAQLYFPLQREQAIERGFVWDDQELPLPAVKKVIPAHALPDDIAAIPDDILQWAVRCDVTGKPFRITAQELKFYREQSIPLPRHSPEQRHLDRFAARNPRKFWSRTCGKCGKGMETTYQPSRPEIVYCEQCYLLSAY